MSATVAEGVVRIRTDTTGTSPAALKREGEKAGKSYSAGVAHSVKGIAGTIGGFFAAEKLGEFAKSSVEAASEDQAAQRKLALAIKNSTGAKDEDIKATEEWLTKNSLATGISKDDLMPVYQQLVSSTGSLTKARKELSTAEDVSAGTGKNLSVVGAALMKANNGTTASLSRLGLKTKTTSVDTLGLEKAHLALTQAQDGVATATKKYGANSDQANAAVVKLHEAQANLHTVQTKGKTTTLSLDDALKKMSETYGGQAAAKAKSFDGTMQRLHATIHEGEVEVGGKLLPVLQNLADWLINDGIPGLEAFGGWVQKNKGWLEPLVMVVGGAVAAYTAYSAALAIGSAAQSVWATLLGTTAAATEAETVAQTELDAAMDANPIGLVVVALGALVGGLIFAYKHSETFRAVVHKLGDTFNWLWEHAVKPVIGFIREHWKLLAVIIATLTGGVIVGALVLLITKFHLVQKAIHVLGAAAVWLWNNAFQPSIKFIVGGIALLIDVWGHMLSALGHLPHFEWAKKAGDAMQTAADQARGFADAIDKIPTHKAVHIDLITTRDDSGVTHSSGGGHDAPNRPGTQQPGTRTGPTTRGSTGGGTGQGSGITVHGDFVTVAHDYDDFTRQTRARTQAAAFGGRRVPA